MGRFVFLLVFVIFETSSCYGQNVNLQNGNFYVSYTDIDLKNTTGIIKELKRTYNSRMIGNGRFGYGWGSKMETRLTYFPDGLLTIHENGSGKTVEYFPLISDQEQIEEMADLMVDIAIQQNQISNSPLEINEKRELYLNNQERRHFDFQMFLKNGWLETQTPPANFRWRSFINGDRLVILTSDGYTRVNLDQKTETFDFEGRLIKIEDKNGNFSKLFYENGHINKIENSDRKSIEIKTNDKGFITQVKTDVNGEWNQIEYTYSNDNLIHAKDLKNNAFAYVYDGKHNLIEIRYGADESGEVYKNRKQIIYDSNLNVSKIIEKNGSERTYNYRKKLGPDGTINDNHLEVVVHKTSDGKSMISYHEYLNKQSAGGTLYLSKESIKRDNYFYEVMYDDLCNQLPSQIVKNRATINFEYDNNCNLTRKSSSDGSVKMYEYHSDLRKISKVIINDDVYKYGYDEKSNITSVIKNVESPILLSYEDDGTISRIINGETNIEITYNNLKQPNSMYMLGVGRITIDYDQDGKVENIDGDQQMAVKIFQTFQNLIGYLESADARYNF